MIHTWVLARPAALALDRSWLSAAEVDRAEASGERGLDFVAGALALRSLAARRLDLPPDEVEVARTCPSCSRHHGRPRLPGTGLHASVTHAVGLVGVAVADVPVGLDLEPGGEELRAWTRHEARGKAVGVGLAGERPDLPVAPLPLPAGYVGSLAAADLSGWRHVGEQAEPARLR